MGRLITPKQIRLRNYDYLLNGCYFVTVCAKNRENLFGEYENITDVGVPLACARNNINLSKIGQIVDRQWNTIPQQYDNFKLAQSYSWYYNY